jgi:hypothetical protein
MPTAGADRRGGLRALLLPTALGLAGCLHLPFAADDVEPWVELRGTRRDVPPAEPLRRVLALPFVVGDAPAEPAEALRRALAQELRSACGFEVVAPSAGELPRSTRDLAASGASATVDALIKLHREWGADAVLAGRLAFARVHGAPALGVELELVDARDGARLWSAKDTVDARDPRVRAALLSFRRVESGAGEEESGDATQVPLDSFARFVAVSLVRTLFRASVPRGEDLRGSPDPPPAGKPL